MTEILEIFFFVYNMTWFLCPFAFVFGLANGIREMIENKQTWNKWLTLASVALLLITASLTFLGLAS